MKFTNFRSIALMALLVVIAPAAAKGPDAPVCKDNMPSCDNVGEKKCSMRGTRSCVVSTSYMNVHVEKLTCSQIECTRQSNLQCWTYGQICSDDIGGCESRISEELRDESTDFSGITDSGFGNAHCK